MYASLSICEKQLHYLKRIGYRHYDRASALLRAIIPLDVSINHKMFRYGDMAMWLHYELSNKGIEKNEYKTIGRIKFDKLINRKSL